MIAGRRVSCLDLERSALDQYFMNGRANMTMVKGPLA